jgi:hypothetical protein
MAQGRIGAIITAAGQDREEITVLLSPRESSGGGRALWRRPGAAAGSCFDQTALPEASLMLTGTSGRKDPHERRGVPEAGQGRRPKPLEAMAQIGVFRP